MNEEYLRSNSGMTCQMLFCSQSIKLELNIKKAKKLDILFHKGLKCYFTRVNSDLQKYKYIYNNNTILDGNIEKKRNRKCCQLTDNK